MSILKKIAEILRKPEVENLQIRKDIPQKLEEMKQAVQQAAKESVQQAASGLKGIYVDVIKEIDHPFSKGAGVTFALQQYGENAAFKHDTNKATEQWQIETRTHREKLLQAQTNLLTEMRAKKEAEKVLSPTEETVTAGPGLYSEIGKRAQDLLYKDYRNNVAFATSSTLGVSEITCTGIKKDELFIAEVNTQLINKNVTTDVKVDTNARLSGTVTIDEPTSGLKVIFGVAVPDQRSGKIELQYQHAYGGISAGVALTANPVVNFSGVVGTSLFSFGADVSYDTVSGSLSKCNAGVSFSNAEVIAAITLNDKGQNLNASYYHSRPLTTMAVGAEISHNFSTNDNTLTIGAQQALNPLTSIKAKGNNHGMASALIQHEWRPKSLFTISGEIDTRAAEKAAKFGFSLALNQ